MHEIDDRENYYKDKYKNGLGFHKYNHDDHSNNNNDDDSSNTLSFIEITTGKQNIKFT